MRRKNNYVMRRLDAPKRVTLPNGRVSYTKCKHVKRSEFLSNVPLRQTYRQKARPRGRRRRGQQGRGFFDTIKKIAKNPTLRKIANKGLRYALKLYNYEVGKIKK